MHIILQSDNNGSRKSNVNAKYALAVLSWLTEIVLG